MDSHSPCLRTGFIAVKWPDAEHRDKRCQMVHNWLHKGLSTDSQIVRPAGKSRHRHHLEVHWNQLPAKLQQPWAERAYWKIPRAGKIWSWVTTIFALAQVMLHNTEEPSPMGSALCAPVRAGHSAKLLTLQHRQEILLQARTWENSLSFLINTEAQNWGP